VRDVVARVDVLAVPARREAEFSSKSVGAVVRREVGLASVGDGSTKAVPPDGLVCVGGGVVGALVAVEGGQGK
jgi:predicted carbohydrate-binding protein with CBM5 and CBM33 domain